MWSQNNERDVQFNPGRTRRVLAPDGRVHVAMLTHCAQREETVEADTCSHCAQDRGLCFDPVTRSWYRACWVDAPDAQRAQGVPGATGGEPRSTESLDLQSPVGKLMQRDVLCVAPDVTVASLTSLLLARELDAAPVVDSVGRPYGVVSKTDLVREEPDPTHSVLAVMTPLVFALPESASIARAAALMASEGVHQVIVAGSDGQVIGMVSSMDIVRLVAATAYGR